MVCRDFKNKASTGCWKSHNLVWKRVFPVGQMRIEEYVFMNLCWMYGHSLRHRQTHLSWLQCDQSDRPISSKCFFWAVSVPLSVWNISGEVLTATDLNVRIKSLGLRRSVILKSLDVATQEKQQQHWRPLQVDPLLMFPDTLTVWPSELPLRTLLPFQPFSSYLLGIWPNICWGKMHCGLKLVNCGNHGCGLIIHGNAILNLRPHFTVYWFEALNELFWVKKIYSIIQLNPSTGLLIGCTSHLYGSSVFWAYPLFFSRWLHVMVV